MDNLLRLLGIAKKAGRLEIGEEPVGAAARARQAKAILVAADAADNTIRRAAHYGEAGNVQWVKTPCTKAELGMAVGRSSCAMVAVMDAGLASAMVEKLAQADPETYGEAAQALGQKAEKVLKRQREKRQHEKNLQKGKLKPWAAPSGKTGAAGRLAEKEPPKPPAGKLGEKRSRPAGTATWTPKGPRPAAVGGGDKKATGTKQFVSRKGMDDRKGRPPAARGKRADGPSRQHGEASSDVKKHR